MSEGNYFVVNRKIFDHWLWKDSKEPATRFEAWIYILNRANWKDSKVLVGNELVEIPRGSFITSQPKLAECFRWGRERVRAFVALLEKDQMITLNCTNNYTRISITKYDTYQISQPADHTTDNQQTVQQTTSRPYSGPYTENKDNKQKKEKKGKNINPLTPFEGVPVWPSQIDTPQTREQWNRWLTYKHAKRKTYKTLDSHEAALRRCAKEFQTPERMIAAIEYSIAQGWDGVYEERGTNGAPPTEKKLYGKDLIRDMEQRLARGETI